MPAAVAQAALTIVSTRMMESVPWTSRPRPLPTPSLTIFSTASRVSIVCRPATWSNADRTTKTDPTMTSPAAMVTWGGRGRVLSGTGTILPLSW